MATDEASHKHGNTPTKAKIEPGESLEIIEALADDLLADLRRAAFSALRHASFDAWRFSTILATKFTFTALFGVRSALIIDEELFAHHAQFVSVSRDLNSINIICNQKRQIRDRERSCKQSLQFIESAIQTAFTHMQSRSICGYAYSATHPSSPSEEIFQLAHAIQQATAEAFFWGIFMLSHDKTVSSAIEKEADACASPNGDINKNKLRLAHTAKDASLEILRLSPLHNMIIFLGQTDTNLSRLKFLPNDKILISPHVIFRSERYLQKASSVIIGRQYPRDLPALYHLSCGGGIVFQIVLLNLMLLLIDLTAAFELELVEGPPEFKVTPSFLGARPDLKLRLNYRRSRLFRYAETLQP